jgi:hypothetical protein
LNVVDVTLIPRISLVVGDRTLNNTNDSHCWDKVLISSLILLFDAAALALYCPRLASQRYNLSNGVGAHLVPTIPVPCRDIPTTTDILRPSDQLFEVNTGRISKSLNMNVQRTATTATATLAT